MEPLRDLPAPAPQALPLARAAVPTATAPRRVLVITFFFPPANNSSGGLRPLKFTKYLREFGWESSVLTVHDRYSATDPELTQQIPPGTPVHRTVCLDIKDLSLLGRYPGFLAVPDRYVPWLLPGLLAAVRAVRRDRIDAIFSTSPMATAHLIAWGAKRATGVPWIADFRDPWVETEGSEVHGRLRQALELRLERGVLNTADRATVTTREFAELMRRRYPSLPSDKIVPVYNGYDEADFAAMPAGTPAGERFTIVHAGLLDPRYRSPRPVLEAVRRGRRDGALPNDLRLRLVGGGPFAASEVFRRLVAELELADVVEVVDRVPYRAALELQAGASVLLLLQSGDDTRMLIPAKAFEYLRTGRPIVAVTPADSATARLVREFSAGFVAEPGYVSAIAGALAAAAHACAASNTTGDTTDRLAEGLARYSRRTAAAELAAVLDSLAGTVAAPPTRDAHANT